MKYEKIFVGVLVVVIALISFPINDAYSDYLSRNGNVVLSKDKESEYIYRFINTKEIKKRVNYDGFAKIKRKHIIPISKNYNLLKNSTLTSLRFAKMKKSLIENLTVESLIDDGLLFKGDYNLFKGDYVYENPTAFEYPIKINLRDIKKIDSIYSEFVNLNKIEMKSNLKEFKNEILNLKKQYYKQYMNSLDKNYMLVPFTNLKELTLEDYNVDKNILEIDPCDDDRIVYSDGRKCKFYNLKVNRNFISKKLLNIPFVNSMKYELPINVAKRLFSDSYLVYRTHHIVSPKQKKFVNEHQKTGLGIPKFNINSIVVNIIDTYSNSLVVSLVLYDFQYTEGKKRFDYKKDFIQYKDPIKLTKLNPFAGRWKVSNIPNNLDHDMKDILKSSEMLSIVENTGILINEDYDQKKPYNDILRFITFIQKKNDSWSCYTATDPSLYDYIFNYKESNINLKNKKLYIYYPSNEYPTLDDPLIFKQIK